MSEAIRRWRLMLGQYSQDQLGRLKGRDARRDSALEFLYDREYAGRGLADKGAGLNPTQMSALKWLGQAQGVFPKDVFETLQSDALTRYELNDLLKDPDVLAQIEPRQELLPVLLSHHSRVPDALKAQLRAVAQKVIDDITKRLQPSVQQAFSGRRNRFSRSNMASAANFDWRATLRDNLTRYDPEHQRIIAERLRFNARIKRQLPWTMILCVDQSGSMTDSVIHAAVLAAILSGLPGVRVKMVLFDTAVLDVTDRLTDPIDTLLSVQLGGGTDIGKALSYCETLVDNPDRTVVALISDFFEGGNDRAMLGTIARLAEARVTQIGLPALDSTGKAWFNHNLAAQAETLGMAVGAMSPDRFAEWLAQVMA